MKKVLSLVLVIAMVLSSMSFAFAGTFGDVDADNNYYKAIETLKALKVIDGYDDGTFKPEKTITRAEMAKLMVELLGYGDLVAGSKSNFADTQGHWADAWIALAAGRGIVIGTGDGKFAPDRTVSYDEVLTMLVRGLGYTDNSNELKNMTWPTNFKVKAAELGITKNVKMASTGADRGGVAQAMANALEATLVSVTVDGDVTLLYDKAGEDKVDRILLTRLATPDYSYNVTPEKVDPNNKNYAGNIVDLGQYMFETLKVYLNDDDEVVYVKSSSSLVVEGTYDDYKSGVLSLEDANEKVKSAGVKTVLAANGIFENGSTRKTSLDLSVASNLQVIKDADYVKVVANDTSKNGKIEDAEVVGVVITYQTKAIRVEQEYVAGKTKLGSLSLPAVNSKPDLVNITVKGDATSLEDIKEDDIVAEYLSEDETVTTLVVTRNTVEGKVTRVDGDDTFYIDGKEYDLARVNVSDVLELGDEGVFFLDHNGEIADFDGSAAGPSNYAVVLGVEDGKVADKFGKVSVKDYPQVKLATQDDETVIFDLFVKVSGNKVTGSAKIGSDDMFDETGLVDGAKLEAKDNLDADLLIKYSLNKDGKISKITVVEDLSDSVFDEIDFEKASNKLSDNVVVFDQTEDYDVVSAKGLPNKFNAFVVRNSSGQITVIVAEKDAISSVAKTSYVYISKINDSYNNDDEQVQTLVVYTDGVKKTILTTGDDVVTGDVGVYNVKYDGELLDNADLETPAGVTTASGINARSNMVKIGEEWFALSDHGTVIGIKGTKVNLRDLNDITKGITKFEVYMTKGEIDLIIIHE